MLPDLHSLICLVQCRTQKSLKENSYFQQPVSDSRCRIYGMDAKLTNGCPHAFEIHDAFLCTKLEQFDSDKGLVGLIQMAVSLFCDERIFRPLTPSNLSLPGMHTRWLVGWNLNVRAATWCRLEEDTLGKSKYTA